MAGYTMKVYRYLYIKRGEPLTLANVKQGRIELNPLSRNKSFVFEKLSHTLDKLNRVLLSCETVGNLRRPLR